MRFHYRKSVLAIGLGLLLTACGHTDPKAVLAPSVAPTSSPAPEASPAPTPAPIAEGLDSGLQQGRIGDTFTVFTPVMGALRVQATNVVNPAPSVSRGPSVADYKGAWEDRGGMLAGSAPAVGKHFTSVRFTFTNASKSAVDNARVGLALLDTQDRYYPPNIDVIPGCTSYQQWGFRLQPGEAATRCVVFQVPDSVTISKVRFGATEDSSGQVVTLAEWATS